MFIHLGDGTVIRSKDVIAILDSNSQNSSSITRQFLQAVESDDKEQIADSEAKSVVVTEEKVYFSPISSLTLKRRSQIISEYDEYHEEIQAAKED
ncbi:extracellular matrix regulator RemB [Marinococcus halophilus]|uniref:extracellular matrix regulator RemB n=1 Tax=Marinococcus halophilus TaxID=1371 RepID=UPI0009A8465A|nr:extracellular matrix/biofilm biosynthesis regulator RemA family protein [Marinococcus halophilus]